jgi:methylated-DNA-[protein]-cysteine S-methyltransferase
MKHPLHWQHCVADTPLGPMRLARSAQGLCGAWFVQDHQHAPAVGDFSALQHRPDDPLLLEAARQLQACLGGQLPGFDLPLDLSAGTAFQQSVWRALCAIPAGQTCSYQALAAQLGKPKAARAVGAAVGRNPVSVIVPCHRVLGSAGALTGYAGGLWRKKALLQIEGLALP